MGPSVRKSAAEVVEGRGPAGLWGRVAKFSGWGVLIGVPALFVFAYLLPSITFVERANLCAVRGFLGLPCPGCGLTRSFVALVHGDLRGSVGAHPLGAVVALWLVYLAGRAAWAVLAGSPPRELLSQGERDLCLFAFLAALLFQWIFHLVLILT